MVNSGSPDRQGLWRRSGLRVATRQLLGRWHTVTTATQIQYLLEELGPDALSKGHVRAPAPWLTGHRASLRRGCSALLRGFLTPQSLLDAGSGRLLAAVDELAVDAPRAFI